MAYRPERSVCQTIAQLIDWIESGNRPVIAQADVRKAFDNVPIADALLDYQHMLAHGDLCWLVEAILRGHDGSARTIGIDQGDPLSPLTLNMRLHAATDLSLQRAAESGGPLWLRYADNYLLACRSVTEGRESIARLAELLQRAGLTLKANSIDVTDLRRSGTQTEVLGYSLQLGADGVNVGLGHSAITSIRDALELAHLEPEPSATAEAVIQGWLRAAGPIFGDVESNEQVLSMLLREAEAREHRELAVDGLREAVESAQRRWVEIRRRVTETRSTL